MRKKKEYRNFIERMKKTEPEAESLEILWEGIFKGITNASTQCNANTKCNSFPKERTNGYILFRIFLVPTLAVSILLLIFGLFSVLYTPAENYDITQQIVYPDRIKVLTYKEKAEIYTNTGFPPVNRYYSTCDTKHETCRKTF